LAHDRIELAQTLWGVGSYIVLNPAATKDEASPAVVMRMCGGLGNQLFQYAFGRAMALRNRVPLLLDCTTGFVRDSYKRQFALRPYQIEAELFSPEEAEVGPAARLLARIGRKARRWFSIDSRGLISEKDPAVFQAEMSGLQIKRRMRFEGYWQHEAYFSGIRDCLLNDLSPRIALSATTLEVADRMRAGNAVAVHVRCMRAAPRLREGEVAKHPASLQIDPTYYERGLLFMAERYANPRFFVFSDNHEWVKRHITLPGAVEHVCHNASDRDHEDMWLMTQCHGHVIANSTFSWWGAWLANYPGKMVVAPASGINAGLHSYAADWTVL